MLIAATATILLLAIGVYRWSSRRRASGRTANRGDRRRGYRIALSTPVFVYGWRSEGPFSENATTLNVSAVGGLIPLAADVVVSQELILSNLQTNEDLTCRVARRTRTFDGKTLVAVDFLQPSPNFWQIEFVSASPSDGESPVRAAVLSQVR